MGCLRDCTSGIAKYLLFFFNLVIFICAILLITLGAIYKSNNAGIDLLSVSTFTIAVGVFIGLIAFFGCCGAIKESSCMLTTYAAILLTLFIIQVVLGILAFVAIKNGNNEFKNEVNKQLTNLYGDYHNNKENQEIVNAFQQSLQCCGINGPTDSQVANGTLIISSCCKDYATPCSIASQHLFHDGCSTALSTFLEKSIKVIGGIAIGFAIIEIMGAIFAFYVRNTIRKQGEYV